jgi:hypothetical protein
VSAPQGSDTDQDWSTANGRKNWHAGYREQDCIFARAGISWHICIIGKFSMACTAGSCNDAPARGDLLLAE